MTPFTYYPPTKATPAVIELFHIYFANMMIDSSLVRIPLKHPEFKGVFLCTQMQYDKVVNRYCTIHTVVVYRSTPNGGTEETYCPQTDYYRTTYSTEPIKQSKKNRENARLQAVSLVKCTNVLEGINQHYSKVDPAHFANQIKE